MGKNRFNVYSEKTKEIEGINKDISKVSFFWSKNNK